MQDIIKYVIWYLHKVVSVYVGQYQVRYFVLTKDCKNICRILSGTLFRTYRRQYVYMQDIIRYIISYSQRVVSVYVGYYQVRYFVLTECSKCIMQDISRYVISYLQRVVSVYVGYYQVFISYLQRVVSVYVGYYQVRYFILTEGSTCICRI